MGASDIARLRERRDPSDGGRERALAESVVSTSNRLGFGRGGRAQIPVKRLAGSTVSNLLTRSLASFEILSHHGDGKSYLRTWTARGAAVTPRGAYGWALARSCTRR
jgi:hypothetical protein